MRFKGNKGANTTKKVPHAGQYIPHVAHGILKKMRLLNYDTKGKKTAYKDDDGVEGSGSGGSSIKSSLGRNDA